MRQEGGDAAKSRVGDGAKDFAAGVAAGVALVVTGHPFDTVKVKLQASNAASSASLGAPKYRSTWQCTSHILRTEGIPGLYRGATSSFIGVAVESSLLFGSYTQIKTALQGGERSAPTPGTVAVAAGVSGGLISLVLCPTELVKCRLQAQSPALSPATSMPTPSLTAPAAVYTSTAAASAAAAACKRAPAMAHASPFSPSTAATTPFAASPAFQSLGRTAATTATGAASRTAVTAATVTGAAISQQQQFRGMAGSAGVASAGRYKGPWDCMVQTVRTNGTQGLFRGLTATAWRESVGNICFFLTYEAIKHRLLPALTHTHSHSQSSHPASSSLDGMREGGEGAAVGDWSRVELTEGRRGSEEEARKREAAAAAAGGGMSEWQRVAAEAATAIASGGLAGIMFWSAVLPMDVIKTRIQTAPASAPPDSLRIMAQCKAILRESGVRGFYAGLVPTLTRAFPANAAAVVAWELTSRLLGVSNS